MDNFLNGHFRTHILIVSCLLGVKVEHLSVDVYRLSPSPKAETPPSMPSIKHGSSLCSLTKLILML